MREDFQVQCDLITAPLNSSAPECSPVKSLGGRSVDDDNDFDYVPPTDLSLEEAEDGIEEYEGSPSKAFLLLLFIFSLNSARLVMIGTRTCFFRRL